MAQIQIVAEQFLATFHVYLVWHIHGRVCSKHAVQKVVIQSFVASQVLLYLISQ